MSTGIETTEIVEPWLYGALTGDATLMALLDDVGGTQGKVINAATDAVNLEPPYVVFNMQSQRDITTQQGFRVQAACIYLVKTVVKGGNYDPATAIFKRVDGLLAPNGFRSVQTDDGVITCKRDIIIQYPEVQDGAQWRHLGATYRIRAHSND